MDTWWASSIECHSPDDGSLAGHFWWTSTILAAQVVSSKQRLSVEWASLLGIWVVTSYLYQIEGYTTPLWKVSQLSNKDPVIPKMTPDEMAQEDLQ